MKERNGKSNRRKNIIKFWTNKENAKRGRQTRNRSERSARRKDEEKGKGGIKGGGGGERGEREREKAKNQLVLLDKKVFVRRVCQTSINLLKWNLNFDTTLDELNSDVWLI